jgi:hypothetical protein
MRERTGRTGAAGGWPRVSASSAAYPHPIPGARVRLATEPFYATLSVRRVAADGGATVTTYSTPWHQIFRLLLALWLLWSLPKVLRWVGRLAAARRARSRARRNLCVSCGYSLA